MIELDDAFNLPENLKQLVKQNYEEEFGLKLLVYIFVSLVFTVLPILAVIFLFYDKDNGSPVMFIVFTAAFSVIPILAIYNIVITPCMQLHKIKTDNYQYYLGKVTDTNVIGSADNSGDSYYLIVDRTIKVRVDYATFQKCFTHDNVIVVYFNNKPDTCVKYIKGDEIEF